MAEIMTDIDRLERIKQEYESYVGQVVRIRDYEDMKSEFGLTDTGAVGTFYSFTREMRGLCGKDFMVEKVETSSNGEYFRLNLTPVDKTSCASPTFYYISTDMLEIPQESDPIEEDETLADFLGQINII